MSRWMLGRGIILWASLHVKVNAGQGSIFLASLYVKMNAEWGSGIILWAGLNVKMNAKWGSGIILWALLIVFLVVDQIMLRNLFLFVCSCFSQIQINHNFRFDSQLFSYVDEYIKYYPTFCVLFPVIVSNVTPHFLLCIKYYATFCFALYSVIVSNITQHILLCILWLYQILHNILCFVSCDCIKYYATFFVLYPVIVSNSTQHVLFCNL